MALMPDSSSTALGESSSPVPPLSPRVQSAYVLAKLAISALDTIFSLYHIDVFLNVHGLTNNWFYVVQSIYIFWNAANDPIFAYIQGQWMQQACSHEQPCRCSVDFFFAHLLHLLFFLPRTDRVRGSKRSALFYGGPLLGITFLLPFLPIGQWCGGSDTAVGLHFLLSMVAFDGIFTYTCLAHCALFAEITTVQSERLAVLRAGEVSMLLTAPLVLLSSSVFSREALWSFRIFAVLFAVACGVALVYASKHVRSVSDAPVACAPCEEDVCSTGKLTAMARGNGSGNGGSGTTDSPPLKLFLRQLLSHRSFLLFVCLFEYPPSSHGCFL